MRHIEIDMKYILVERIKEELGDDGEILREIPITAHASYVIARGGMEYKLYKIETDFPNIQEYDGKEFEDPFGDFPD